MSPQRNFAGHHTCVSFSYPPVFVVLISAVLAVRYKEALMVLSSAVLDKTRFTFNSHELNDLDTDTDGEVCTVCCLLYSNRKVDRGRENSLSVCLCY